MHIVVVVIYIRLLRAVLLKESLIAFTQEKLTAVKVTGALCLGFDQNIYIGMVYTENITTAGWLTVTVSVKLLMCVF